MEYAIDARGLACPLPVVNAKNALKKMSKGDVVVVMVDNEIAVQNLTKFANVRNHGVQAEKLGEQEYRVRITAGESMVPETDDDEEEVCLPSQKNNTVVVLSSNQMGSGEEALGKTLMKAFTFALTKQDTFPKTVLLYNSGAFLSCEGSDSLEDLKLLEAEGTEILTCGTCLNYYGLTEKLQVGGVTNMYDIVEIMEHAGNIVKP